MHFLLPFPPSKQNRIYKVLWWQHQGKEPNLSKNPAMLEIFVDWENVGGYKRGSLKPVELFFGRLHFCSIKKRFYVPKCSNDMGNGKIWEKVLKMKMLKFHKGILLRKLNVFQGSGRHFRFTRKNSHKLKIISENKSEQRYFEWWE